MYLSRDFVGFYPGIFAPSGFRLLQIQKENLEIFSSQGVQLRKVSHWPPWLIKIFRKSIPAKIHKRVSFISILCKSASFILYCLHRSWWVSKISRLLEIWLRTMEPLSGTTMTLIWSTMDRARSRCSETATSAAGAPTMSGHTELAKDLSFSCFYAGEV